jgi:hypothetical protein
VIQALVFLLDFGVPWRGAIKDLFATMPLTPGQYHNQFVKRAEMSMGQRVYRVGLDRVQATIAAALEANRQNKVALPKEYNETRHLVERWVLHPAAAILQRDTTVDELGDRPLVPDRSQQPLMVDLRGTHGKEVLSLLSQQIGQDFEGDDFEGDDFEEEAIDEVDFEDHEDQDLVNFEDIVEDVQGTYADSLDAWSGAPCWKPDWITDYLATLCPEPERLDELTLADDEFGWIRDTWLTLDDFLFYLDDHAYEINTWSDVQGFSVSEHIREDAWDWDDDRGRSRVEDLRQFFTYLAGRGLMPAQAPVFEALAHMLAQPEQMTLLDRPEPFGGETAVWLRDFGGGEAEPLSYREWWTALVLEKKFRRDREKFRREAHKKPDGESKLALLDRLESRLSADPESLGDLDNERPATRDDYKRAERWFDQENVSDARAW